MGTPNRSIMWLGQCFLVRGWSSSRLCSTNVVQVGVLVTPPHVFLVLLHICIVENTISKWKGYKENNLV
jgi:hypothetical protein